MEEVTVMDLEGLTRLVAEGSELFDEMCQSRHDRGQQEYGTFTFLDRNVTEMAMEELADADNYLRYLFIKLHILNVVLDKELGANDIQIGAGAFTPTTEADKE